MENKLNLAIVATVFSFGASATIVEIETTQGKIEVNLFDKATPKTVANFLSYVEDGSYNETIIHHSIDNYIVQGGGYQFDGEKLKHIKSKGYVQNEPVYANVKGTIAMAKPLSSHHRATSQWFFNMKDNQAYLDYRKHGYTVFGQVTTGFDVLEKIQKLHHCRDIPYDGYTKAQCADPNVLPSAEDFVSVINIDIKDSTPDTARELKPVKARTTDPLTVKYSSSAWNIWGLTLFGLLWFFRLKVNNGLIRFR